MTGRESTAENSTTGVMSERGQVTSEMAGRKPKPKKSATKKTLQRKTRRSVDAQPFFKYEEAAMNNAMKSVQSGMSTREAARVFNVPKTTLQRKLNLGLTAQQKMGPCAVLNPDEEKMLIKWIFHLAEAGFPIEKDQLLDNVKRLVQKLRRKTPFREDRPGYKWFQGFLARNPEVTKRLPQNYPKARQAVTEESLRTWFQNVKQYFTSHELLDVLNDPKRIFNLDESAFFLSPGCSTVLVKKNASTVYNFTANSEKECITVLLGGNAAGDPTPPMMVLKLKKLDESHFASVPNHWLLGKICLLINFLL